MHRFHSSTLPFVFVAVCLDFHSPAESLTTSTGVCPHRPHCASLPTSNASSSPASNLKTVVPSLVSILRLHGALKVWCRSLERDDKLDDKLFIGFLWSRGVPGKLSLDRWFSSYLACVVVLVSNSRRTMLIVEPCDTTERIVVVKTHLRFLGFSHDRSLKLTPSSSPPLMRPNQPTIGMPNF